MYPVTLTPDDNGTVLVTCADLPEVTTFGEDEEDAIARAADAIEEALAARIAGREDIPASPVVPDRAIEEALFARERGDIPGSPRLPDRPVGFVQRWLGVPPAAPPPESGLRIVRLPPLTVAKVELYRAARAQGVSKAELGRRLGWHGPQVDRLFDLNHRSTFENIDRALRAIGKRLEVSVRDAA
jgi:antitoxin HicB